MICTRHEAPHRRELCNEASVWMWIWTLGCLSDALLTFSSSRRSSFSVAVGGLWRIFEPVGQHEVSFSSELCSLNRKKCGSKERAALVHDPPKTFNDMEMCTQSTVSAKNEIMSGSCRSWTQTEEITMTMWTQQSMFQTFSTIFKDVAIKENKSSYEIQQLTPIVPLGFCTKPLQTLIIIKSTTVDINH